MAKKDSRREAEQSRRARAEQLRAEQQRGERRRTLAIWISVAAVLALIVGGTAWGLRSASQEQDAFAAAVQEFDVTTEHVATPVNYAQTPPAGGKHNGVWLNCGIYEEPVQNENAAHSQEHGAVWITYDPELSEADVQTLTDAMPSTYAILSPFPDLPAPVVVSSWGRQLQLDGADDPRLQQFIRDFSQASDIPEAGAACTGGTDTATPLQGEPTES